MQMERRALFNSLRMHWLLDPHLKVEEWQVFDYRGLSLETIFQKLNDFGLYWDKMTFQELSDHYDTPEELAQDLETEEDQDPRINDQIYLLVFELWRRLVPEKMSVSVFCDELDHLINQYDNEQLTSIEPMEDILANLQLILEENCDQGANSHQVFESLADHCANDLESFLYDFINEQIDNKNFSYASELLDGFIEYVIDVKWFDFLRVRIVALKDIEEANNLIQQILHEIEDDADLEFQLEILGFLVQEGEHKIFGEIVEKSIPLLKTELDFQDLLRLCSDYFHYLDKETEEASIQNLLKERKGYAADAVIRQNDPAILALKKIF